MKTFGKNSFAAFLTSLLRIVSWVLWAILGVLFLFGIPALIVDSFYDLSWVADAPPPMLIWPSAIMFAILVLAAQIIIHRLRRIFATLVEGDPFVPENARHMRTIWITLVVFEISRMVFSSGTLLARELFKEQEALARLQGEFQIHWPLWMAVAALVVLTEIFHEGARLRQEQKLTI